MTKMPIFFSIIALTVMAFSACNFSGVNPLNNEIPEDPVLFGDADLTGSWEAYNDCVYSAAGNATNVTQFSNSNSTGTLLKYSDGTSTGVDVLMEWSNLDPWNSSGTPNVGTDADSVFGSIVNLDEIASYGNSSINWHYQVTFSGLDPAKTYAFVTTANRNESNYAGNGTASRWTQFSISGADNYQNISSAGVIEITEDILKMNTGYNTVDGQVIAWTGISSASGCFIIRSENVGAAGPGEPYKSYGIQGFKLIELTP